MPKTPSSKFGADGPLKQMSRGGETRGGGRKGKGETRLEPKAQNSPRSYILRNLKTAQQP